MSGVLKSKQQRFHDSSLVKTYEGSCRNARIFTSMDPLACTWVNDPTISSSWQFGVPSSSFTSKTSTIDLERCDRMRLDLSPKLPSQLCGEPLLTVCPKDTLLHSDEVEAETASPASGPIDSPILFYDHVEEDSPSPRLLESPAPIPDSIISAASSAHKAQAGLNERKQLPHPRPIPQKIAPRRSHEAGYRKRAVHRKLRYPCSYCSLNYLHKDSLNRHERTKHTSESTDSRDQDSKPVVRH